MPAIVWAPLITIIVLGYLFQRLGNDCPKCHSVRYRFHRDPTQPLADILYGIWWFRECKSCGHVEHVFTVNPSY